MAQAGSVKISELLEKRKLNADGLIAIVQEVQSKQTKSGAAYLTGKLKDETGIIKFNIWDTKDPDTIAHVKAGMPVVVCSSKLDEYEGTMQINVTVSNRVSPQLAESSGIIPASPYSMEELDQHMEQILELIRKSGPDNDLACIDDVLSVMRDDGVLHVWKTMPAGIKQHQAYVRGLYEHSIMVTRLAHRMVTAYSMHPGFRYISIPLLLTGALFHDIGKVFEYELSPLGLATGFTLEGGLSGHLVLGAEYLSKLYTGKINPDSMAKLRHMVTAHHGQRDWGSPVEPAMLEAYCIHHADVIDSSFEWFTTPQPGGELWIKQPGRAPVLNPASSLILL